MSFIPSESGRVFLSLFYRGFTVPGCLALWSQKLLSSFTEDPEEIDVLKMTNTLQNQVLKYKKIPIRKPGTLCCPEYECWESFETLESLKQHIILTHGILALSRLRPKSDRTFDPSDDLIKSAYGYSESHPGEIEKVINDIENKLNLK